MIVLTGHAANLPAVRPTLPQILQITEQTEQMDASIRVIIRVI